MFTLLSGIYSYLGADNGSASGPIYEVISTVGPYAIGVVLMLCVIYGIILGVKLAKAEDKESRAKIEKTLKNFLFGAVSIIILLSILYAIRDYV